MNCGTSEDHPPKANRKQAQRGVERTFRGASEDHPPIGGKPSEVGDSLFDTPQSLPQRKSMNLYKLLNRYSAWILFPIILSVFLQAGVPISRNTEQIGKLPVFASILPLAFFVERIGGEHVEVHVMVGPGQSPATYEPTSKQLVQLARARVFFSIGVPFEKQILPRIRSSFKSVEVVDTRAGIHVRSIDKDHAADPHIWLDPRLVKIMARNIRDALIRIDPSHHPAYNSNCDVLIADLEAIDREITQMLAPLEGAELYVFHPAYGYFADAYGLVQVSVESGGATPGTRHLVTLIERAKRKHVRAVFVQPQFSSKTAATIADEIGAEVMVMDPLSRDYLSNLKEMAASIRSALTYGGAAAMERRSN